MVTPQKKAKDNQKAAGGAVPQKSAKAVDTRDEGVEFFTKKLKRRRPIPGRTGQPPNRNN